MKKYTGKLLTSMKQLMEFIKRFFIKRKSRSSHFADAIVEGIIDTFKETRYKTDDTHKMKKTKEG